MTGVVISVLIFFLLAGGLGGFAYFTYHKKLRRAKAIERGLKMVPILIHLPPQSSDTQAGNRDLREIMREKTSQAEVLYNLLAGTATEGFKSNFYGQRHIALELVVANGLVHFFAAVPVALVGVVKQAVTTAYPGARLEEVEDHNIFNQEGRLAATLGGEMVLRAPSAYPIATYEQLERDPMEAILTAVSALEKQDGVAVQIMLRPAGQDWVKKSITLADELRKGKHNAMKFSAMDLAKAALKAPAERRDEERLRTGGAPDVSQLQLSQVERIEEKTKHPGFEVLVRVIVSTGSVMRSQQLLREISTAFALYESPGLNGFKFLPAVDVQGLVTAFIFRFFPNELKSNVLSSAELATLFHLPDSQFTPSASVERQQSKQVDGPVQLPAAGLMFGYNEFRGVRKEIRMAAEDRRRHTYILGQTGTGKSTMLENLAVQDMLSGNGFAFIDPHGDSAEKLLALVPKERAEDVIYFNPADTQHPLGLNLFEFNDPAQKDFLVQETISMLYKLYDPGHTGIIGPRYEHWYRNAALTLMSDPNGSTFIEIPKVFTDTEYLKNKFKYLKDPTVIDFWTKEMGQTSDYHKSEMLGWFVSKFGAFQNNEMMRNIIGQTKSSFNIRDVMDKKKILIVNLSKGRIGELNSQLLGMIFVIKFQAAAMSRADMPEAERSDFALYVDEFQNFSTDSFASILSEARKYHLNLIVANQFIGQLSTEIRDAVFGNIGTIVAHRMGPDDAEFMTKQFAPVFDAGDLVNIPNYQAAMRLMIGGLPSQPFTILDMAPIGNPNAEIGVAIKQLSAAKYGHDKAAVEADLTSRLTGQALPAVSTASVVSAASAVGQPVAAVSPAGGTIDGAVAVSPPVATATQALSAVALTPALDGGAPTAPSVSLAGPPPQDMINLALAEAMSGVSAPAQPAADAVAWAADPAAPATDVAAPVDVAVQEGLSHTPPPIGAAPIDLPDLPELQNPGTLSLNDITGEKPEAEESDPYAEIDILGPSAPIHRAAPQSTPEPDWSDAPTSRSNEPAIEVAVEPPESEALEAPAMIDETPMAVEAPVEPPMEAPVETPVAEPAAETDDELSGLPEGVHIMMPPAIPNAAEPVAVLPEAPAAVMPTATMVVAPEPAAMVIPAEPLPVAPAAPVVPLPVMPAAVALEPATTAISHFPVPAAEAVAAAPVDLAATTPQAAAVATAEHEIDDLLSVSLIHPDRKAARLDSADEPSSEAVGGRSAGHTRVIEPLAPIQPEAGIMPSEATAEEVIATIPVAESLKPSAGVVIAPSEAPTPAAEDESPLHSPVAGGVIMPQASSQPAEPMMPVLPMSTPIPMPAPVLDALPKVDPEPDEQALADLLPKPAADPEAPNAEPAALAPGEISVDASGNVIVG